jgi:hypothetical protein
MSSHLACAILFKGTVSRDFLLLVFFMNQFTPGPSQIAAVINDAGGKLPPVSTTPADKFATNVTTPVANNGNNYQTADKVNLLNILNIQYDLGQVGYPAK